MRLSITKSILLDKRNKNGFFSILILFLIFVMNSVLAEIDGNPIRKYISELSKRLLMFSFSKKVLFEIRVSEFTE